MAKKVVFLVWALGLLSSAGCSKSTTLTDDDDDGDEIMFDPATPIEDAGEPPLGDGAVAAPTDIGDACASQAECSGLCFTADDGFRDGYCSAACGNSADCGEGAACVPTGDGQSLCFATCTPGGDPRSCRAGYGCSAAAGIAICLPGCTDDTDCSDGLVCDPDGGFDGAGRCHDADAQLGDPCDSSSDCQAGGNCFSERRNGWPSGVCVQFGCDPDSNTGCPDGAQCLPTGRGGMCFKGCSSDDMCRTAYECGADADYPDRQICLPACTLDSQCSDGRVCNRATGYCSDPFSPADLGRACSTADDVCDGGTCLTEFESGLPGSYCVYEGCDPTSTVDVCAGDGVCIADRSGAGACYDGCSTSAECRAGYTCQPKDAANPDVWKFCAAACTDDSQCANDDFVCNNGTGFCTVAFDPASLGAACTDRESCAGGTCMTETFDGWPGGMCTYGGCRLSGDGPAETCGTGSTCVDDGLGDAALGVCVPTCTTDTSGACRSGYACVAPEGMTSGVCRAACATDADCSEGRTCGAAGLCGAAADPTPPTDPTPPSE